MSSRTVVLSCALFASFAGLFACQLLHDSPPAAPLKPAASSDEPAPLPPAEAEPPPVETAGPAEPPDAKPVEPGITATGAPTRGTLPKAVLDEKLKSIGPAVQACYESGLKTKPELHGNLNINFVVAPDGKVAHADSAEGDDALDDPATVACILNQIRQLQFPQPRGGRVFVNYPLKLEKSKP